MNRDEVMALANQTAGQHWMDEAHIQRFFHLAYTAGAKAEQDRKPLAEWRITDLMADIDPEDVCSWSFRQGVYAAEKHHGVRS